MLIALYKGSNYNRLIDGFIMNRGPRRTSVYTITKITVQYIVAQDVELQKKFSFDYRGVHL